MLLLIIPLICPFFFLSKQIFGYKFLSFYDSQSLQIFNTHWEWPSIMWDRKQNRDFLIWYKYYESFVVLCEREPDFPTYFSLNFFIFLSLQFSNIKEFHLPFPRDWEAHRVETWSTHGQYVDVSCILESGAGIYLFLHFFNFLSL